MPHNKVAGEDPFKAVKFMLVFRQSEEGAAFTGELTQSHCMVLVVRHEKRKLVAETKKSPDACLVSRDRKVRQ